MQGGSGGNAVGRLYADGRGKVRPTNEPSKLAAGVVYSRTVGPTPLPLSRFSAKVSLMATIRMGIIGTGGMANGHAGNFSQMPGVRLTACMDTVPERSEAFAEKHGFQHSMTDAADVLDACDAVAIVTPDRFHVPLVLQAFKADRHVLCEKPLALTLHEAKKAARAAAKATERGLIHMVNFSHRSGAFEKTRKLIESGRLGELRYFRSAYFQGWINATVHAHWSEEEKRLWRLSKDAGSPGALGDLGVHVLDYITALTGPIEELQCRFAVFPCPDRDGTPRETFNGMKLDANQSALMTLRRADGVTGSCDVTRLATGFNNEVIAELYGTEGAIRISQGRWGLVFEGCLGNARHKNPPQWKPIPPAKRDNNGKTFIRGIKRGEPVQPDIVRGAEVQAYLDAAERSAAEGGKYVKVRKWR